MGTELRDKSRNIVQLIVRANSSQDKAPHLLELREEVEALMLLVRLCKETRAFKNFTAFEFAARETAAVGRQNEGRLRAGRNKGGPESSRARV